MNDTKSKQRAELYAIGSTILQANYLDDLIEEFKDVPEEKEFVQYCKFLKRVRTKLEYADANMNLRAQFEAAQKERSGKDDSPNKNTNKGEFIDNPEAA